MSDRLGKRWARVGRDPIVIVLVVAFILRFAWLLNARPEPVSDFLVYRWMAFALLDEGFIGVQGPSAFWLPGYPVFLAAVAAVSRATFWLSFVMVLLSTAMCWLVHRLGLAMGLARRTSVIAAAICAVAPPFVVYSPILGTEHLFVLVVLASLMAAIAVSGQVSWRVAAAGALLGFAVLVRGEALFYAPVVVALIWWSAPRGRRFAATALLVGGLVLPLAPWVVRNMVVVGTGPALSTVGGMNFYFAHNPDHYGWTTDIPWTPGDDIEANTLGWELGLRYIAEHPTSLFGSTLNGLRRQLGAHTSAVEWNARRSVGSGLEFEDVPLRGFDLASVSIVAWTAVALNLAAAAFLLWRRWPMRMRIIVLGITVTNLLGYTVLFFGDARFRYTLDAILAIPAALALEVLWAAGRSAASPTEPQETQDRPAVGGNQ